MRICLITGSFPPDACGVGDYTCQLATALEKAQLRVELFHQKDWGVAGIMAAIKKVLAQKDSIVHVQYPAMGYGYSLGPQLCALSASGAVTLHEFSAAHIARKLSMIPFTLRASSRVVLGSEFEKQELARRMPWVRKRLQVIPIGSNLGDASYCPDERSKRIAYFGLIMPNKGLEDFVRFAQIMRTRSHKGPISIIGKIPAQHRKYARHLLEACRTFSVEWIVDRDPEEVSRILAQSAICYLPFPDGASDRRGSLKAVCSIGLPCITTKSESTPQELADVVVDAANAEGATGAALSLLANEGERWSISRKARDYAQTFSWERIARAHISMYSEMQRFESFHSGDRGTKVRRYT